MSGQLPTDEPVTQGETTQTHEVAKFLRNYHVALVTLEGPGEGENVPVTRLPFIIGRGNQATMIIDNETISRNHAEIRLSADGRLEVLDKGSSNGSFVNGERVTAALIDDGDQIRFGAARFELALEERPQRVPISV
ncbi:hypothetical protein DRQ53_03620 [bacterium]|nr:MAG: hypothetical protein DRQ32_01765 [bacterium]RKZ17424.1 MAG: hypothetical protein DRQ53_03620 [bacterium]